MTDENQTSGTEEDGRREEQPSAAEKAREAQEAHEAAQEKMKELEEMDEPPTDLDDWPDDAAKYVTFGGGEGDHSYAEGPEAKLGPSDLQRRADGSVLIEGEEVDNPDDYKADPVPGGPTDPGAVELPSERRRREKMERMYGEDEAIPDALRKTREQEGGESEDPDAGEQS